MAANNLFLLRQLPLHCKNVRWYGYVHRPKKRTPHLLGYGDIWRKCYVVHARTSLLEALTKYQWMTKTVLVEGLPSIYDEIVIEDETVLKKMKERCGEYLKRWTFFTNEKHLAEHEVRDGLLYTILSVLWPQEHRTASHLSSSTLLHAPHTECYWRHNGVNYICQSDPMFILNTTNSLPLFIDVDSTPEGICYPDVNDYQPSNIGLFKHSFDQITVSCGCKIDGPSRIPHTIFTYCGHKSRPNEISAQSLIQSFTNATAFHVQHAIPLDIDLEYPVINQVIVTDGQRFTFGCYQLNTLNFLPDSTSKRCNTFWLGPTYNLFEYTKSPKLSTECLQLLTKFILHVSSRQKLAYSGFQLRQLKEEIRLQKQKVKRRKAHELRSTYAKRCPPVLVPEDGEFK